MAYFAPDTLAWEALETGHSAWISWLLSGRLETFYDGLRWPGWREDAAALDFAQGISVYPFLWTMEAHVDLAATSRRPAPMREILGVAADFARLWRRNEARLRLSRPLVWIARGHALRCSPADDRRAGPR